MGVEGLIADYCIVVLLFAGVPLVAAAVVGTIVAFLQTATQIQDASLSYLAKVLAAGAALIVVMRPGGEFLSEVALQTVLVAATLGRGGG